MNYTITKNTEYNSLEIVFDGKPSVEVRDALKALRFRWHGVKKCWYGYTDEQTVRAAIDGRPTDDEPKAPTNKYGVQIGDLFSSSWGYDQTNNSFFQVVALCGESSVRVREVHPAFDADPTGPMSEDRVYTISRDILPPASSSVFIKDQERGDIKRLKSFAADGKSNPQFTLSSFANAYLCTGDTCKMSCSWYA